MKYRHTEQYRSKKYPEVVATLRRLSYGQRLQLSEELQVVAEELAKTTNEDLAAILLAKVNAAYLRNGLVRFEGLEIEDLPLPEGYQQGTPATLLEFGPADLVVELAAKIRALAGLDEDERKNSPSPSTLPASTPAGGSANPASAPEITAGVTA